MSAAAAGLGLLGIALPWAGWYGVRSYGFGVLLLGALALAASAWSGARRGLVAASLAGLVAGGLLAKAWLSTPGEPLLGELRSTGALTIGMIAALAVVAAAVAALRRPQPPRALGTLISVDRRRAARSAVVAAAGSRLLVLAAGALAFVIFGVEASVTRPDVTVPFGAFGDALTAPSSAWDAGYYLQIAQYGYALDDRLQAFFPLFPALVRLAAGSPQAALITGIGVSFAAFTGALYLLHRLTTLELGPAAAGRTVTLMALSPMAVFFSAVYTESLFLLLSIGMFYAARRERWFLACLAGTLAAVTRPTGLLLLVPLAWLMVYGASEQPAVQASPLDRARSVLMRPVVGARAWLLLALPAGLAAFLAYTALHGHPWGPVDAQKLYWHHTFRPFDGFVRGGLDAVRSLHQLLVPGSAALAVPSYVQAGQLSEPRNLAIADLTDFAFFAAAIAATIGVFRRLPIAYGLYGLTSLLVIASTSSTYEPLVSAPRYAVVLFPCQMWLGARVSRPRQYRVTLVASGLLLAVFAARFATWHWVA